MNQGNFVEGSIQDVQDIKKMMQRSSRFVSLSGMSGVATGLCALAGAAIANIIIDTASSTYENREAGAEYNFNIIKWRLLLLGTATFITAFLFAFYFTRRKARQSGETIWNYSSKRLLWNMMIPLASGGLFILAMLQQQDWKFIASACLIFYGLALINASKYTLPDIRFLGFGEIALGLISTQFLNYGLYFLALGFGVLHIVYGIIMWMKYDRVKK